MSITEAERHVLHQRLEEVLGPDQASFLMEQLPPVGWADVATKRDLDGLHAATKRDIAELRTATKTDLAHLENSLRGDMTHLEQVLRAELTNFGDRIENRLLREQRTYMFAMLTAFVALMAVTLTVT